MGMPDSLDEVSDAQTMRHAGRERLSLAFMDARNRLLRRFAALEDAGRLELAPREGLDAPLWLLGHVGWYQEAWIARNVQRTRGDACDAAAPRLASIDPQADRCYDPTLVGRDERSQIELPDAQAARAYLVDTLEVTLDLLAGCDESDESLYFFRRALFHEDQRCEDLLRCAQTLGVALPGGAPAPRGVVAREPLWLPATRWMLGSVRGGFMVDNEKWAHEVAVPEFEIDAQPVTWQQFAEFIEDGGYDEPRWWSDAGREWLEHEGRRAPREVEQVSGGVLQRRFGQLLKVPSIQPVLHLSWFEAQAWCHWAGRRLPTEVEWELAAATLARRGFATGEVWEWTATRFEPYPGFVPDPDRLHSVPHFGASRVLRGGSFASPSRLKHARLRHFADPARDDLFCGFRSCSV